MPSIHFLDVTNRDGVQTARTGLSKFGKIMVNYYLGRLGVAQSEIGFPFLFHEVPYVRACLALAEAGAFGDLRLSGWCRAVPADVEAAVAVDGAGRPPAAALQRVDLHLGPDDRAQVPRQARPVRDHRRDDRRGGRRPGGRSARASGSTRRTGRGPTTGTCWSSRRRRGRRARRESGTATRSAATPPGGSGSGSPSWPPRSASRSRPTATTTWAWPWPTRCPARSATWTPGRTRG